MNKAFRLPDNYKPYLDERNKRILEMISPEKNHKILVIGTGVYPKTEFFLFHNFKCKNVFSIDIDKDNLDRAREILPELNFLYANAQKKLPFENREFDVVVMTEVLEHLKDERLILKEIRRVLKKNGALVLSVPKRRWFNIFSPITHVQHIREYCEKRIIQTLEKNGFSVRMMFV
ncbi:MAG: class I SAM-dependent methyltransferase, partial [Nanoarchaeota archaeon]|nr:class I SAM-dependent methyltransferase [Nanoarchaeota archaeon]